jgi:hypothetical protein
MIFIFLSYILKAFIIKDQEKTILFLEFNVYFFYLLQFFILKSLI